MRSLSPMAPTSASATKMIEVLRVLVQARERSQIFGEVQFKPTGGICGAEVMPIGFGWRAA